MMSHLRAAGPDGSSHHGHSYPCGLQCAGLQWEPNLQAGRHPRRHHLVCLDDGQRVQHGRDALRSKSSKSLSLQRQVTDLRRRMRYPGSVLGDAHQGNASSASCREGREIEASLDGWALTEKRQAPPMKNFVLSSLQKDPISGRLKIRILVLLNG